jgi:hypothetical protein
MQLNEESLLVCRWLVIYTCAFIRPKNKGKYGLFSGYRQRLLQCAGLQSFLGDFEPAFDL